MNEEIVKVSNVKNLNNALITINCNQANWQEKNSHLVNLVKYFAPPITRRLHILESANLEMAYVACGKIDAYINPRATTRETPAIAGANQLLL